MYLEKVSSDLDNFSRLRFDDQGDWNVRMDHTVLGDAFKIYGESHLGNFEPNTGEDFAATQNLMYRFGVKGIISRFDYGMKYYSAGEDFDREVKSSRHDPKAGKAGGELWGKWKLGRWGLRDPSREIGTTCTMTLKSLV